MQDNRDNSRHYEDILGLPHHVSITHPHMAVSDRAAQFLPFAALTGHEAAIRETARLTDRKIELNESSKEILNEKLLFVMERLSEQPTVSVTYFMPDEKKDGGSYITVNGSVKKLDEYKSLLILMDGTIIPFDSIIDLDGEVFRLIR